MSINLTDPIFNDEDVARKHFEAIRWPNGPECPHCGTIDQATELKGKSTRKGVWKCRACAKPFSATVGTLYERSHIPLHKWLLATHLLCSSKKGMSAHQLWRMLGFGSYKTAWFVAHRIREGMRDDTHKAEGGLGSANTVVEADETYIGGKAKNRATRRPAPKKTVLSVIERDGRAKSFHVANVMAESVRPIIVTNVNRASVLIKDESGVYPRLGREFAAHHTVNHSANEYAALPVSSASMPARTSSPLSNAGLRASITASRRRTCIATSRNLTSDITTAPGSAVRTQSAPAALCRASRAVASLITSLVNPPPKKKLWEPSK